VGLGLSAAATRALLDPLLAVVFPAACASCGEPLARPLKGPLCGGCWERVERHQGSLCGCGAPLAAAPAAPAAIRCGRCRRSGEVWTRGASLGPFRGALRDAIHALKYSGRLRAAPRLAELMLAEPAVRDALAAAELIVPLPLHPRRREQRGFNQAELVAGALAKGCGLRLATRALVRRSDTRPQTGLRSAERRRNVQGAFAVRCRAAIDGRVVVLVDDVLTTGATARAAARALLRGGAAEVRLLTLARAL
jgi:ComF family protein